MYKSQFIWISLGIGALILRWLTGPFPGLIENLYSRGLFLGIRWMIDYLLAWSPVPLIYIFLSGLLVLLGWGIVRIRRRKETLKRKFIRSSLSVLAFTGGVIFFFLLLWGFNYARIPIEQQLALDAGPLSYEELWDELEVETNHIIRLRNNINGAGDEALTEAHLPEDLEKLLRRELEAMLKGYGFPTTGRVRARNLYPKGIFLRFSSSGLYFPLTGEGHVDAGLHALQKPHVMAHELSHGYGFGDEGTCNFLAYISCHGSSHPFVAYAGHLDHWRTLAANCRSYDPDRYLQFRQTLPAGIRADLDAVNQTLEKYPDIMPRLRYAAYDAYLKAQGIEEGMINYSRVITLVKAWRGKKEI